MIDTARVQERAHERVSAADRVYGYTKAGILSRRYADHDLLSEGELAEAVGVSRTPVREALLRLEAEGLVRLLPKRGALILPVTPGEVADVLETRRVIELHAVRRAVAAHDAQLPGRLHDHLDRMRAAARARDARAYAEADRDFHLELVVATGNAIMTKLYGSLRDRQLRMGVVNLLDPAGDLGSAGQHRMRATIAEHEAILAAVSGRSVRAAEAAVTAHLERAEQQLR